jgi:RHS repeat-associated protein
LTTSNVGVVVSQARYKPFGETRWSYGAMPNNRKFNGNMDDGAGLIDYGARMLSPLLGRFISADSIVPRPGDPQALNRYSYVGNSPLSRIDPSGNADCAAGDNACWQSEWGWKNRWYEAHGYFWESNGWTRNNPANFRDEGILRDTAGEAGISFDNTLFGAWDFASGEMQLIGQGIVAFANKLGGLAGFAQLKTLLGGDTSFERYNLPGRSHAGGGQLAYGEVWPHTIRVLNDFVTIQPSKIETMPEYSGKR